ncbi:MAG: hypothetical protein PWP46_2042 [Fusobacteriaceae bacterium]|jgi:hypothetical protein|nr:hypothetical protein [Fusobacteriales bacterium]MDN5305156.1 hypothetical protein [Fusobacteriaceae bacterium]
MKELQLNCITELNEQEMMMIDGGWSWAKAKEGGAIFAGMVGIVAATRVAVTTSIAAAPVAVVAIAVIGSAAAGIRIGQAITSKD